MHSLLLVLFGSLFLFLLTLAIFLYHSKQTGYLKFLLSTALSGIICYVIVYILTNSGMIREFPRAFNKALPLYYLIAPCLYLYTKGSINPEYARCRRKDILHFLISIPGVISIIPYNLLGVREQTLIVEQIAKDLTFALKESEYIVNPLHWFFFPLSGLIYSVYQFREIITGRKHGLNTHLTKWFLVFTSICLIIFSGMLLINIAVLNNMDKAWYTLGKGNSAIFLSFSVLALAVFFFLNPSLLYGIEVTRSKPESYRQVSVSGGKQPNQDAAQTRLNKVENEILEQIEHFLNSQQIFRKPGLTLSEFSSVSNIPNYKLTEVFNHHHRVNFKTHINNLRIAYAKARLDAGDWKIYTLEAIAFDSGFSSRNTFFIAFKKITRITPSAYVTSLRNAQSDVTV